MSEIKSDCAYCNCGISIKAISEGRYIILEISKGTLLIFGDECMNSYIQKNGLKINKITKNFYTVSKQEEREK